MNLKQIQKYLKQYRRYIPIVFYMLLVSLILAPTLNSKYILSFDMIFTPTMQPGEAFNPINIYRNILHLNALFLPAWLLQKIVFFVMFFGIGFLFYKLSKYIFKNEILSLVLGTFYLVNPFVYDRYIAGHWLFLIGYALTPIFFMIVIKLFTEDNYLRHLKSLFLIWVITPFISKHHFVLFGIIFLIFTVWEFINQLRIWRDISLISKKSSLNIAINLLWIIPTFLFSSNLDFTIEQLNYFSSYNGGPLGLFGNLITMNGFWLEGGIVDQIFTRNIFSFYPWIIILTLPILGGTLICLNKLRRVKYFSKTKPLERFSSFLHELKISKFSSIVLPLSAITFLGFILSLGSYGLIGEIYRLFYDQIPILRGFREPQKFLNLYILGFILFFGVGVKVLSKVVIDKSLSHIKNIRYIILGIILILLLSSSYPIFWSASSQVRSYDYPEIYYETNDFLSELNNKNEERTKLLVLPYNPFIEANWTDYNRILNPAHRFFDGNIIATEDAKISGSEFEQKDCDIYFEYDPGFEDDRTYASCFNKDDSPEIFRTTLQLLNINYIMVNKTSTPINTDLFIPEYFDTILESDDAVLFQLKETI